VHTQLNERLALIQLYQGNARIMPIAAYRKWLNFQVHSEAMTCRVLNMLKVLKGGDRTDC
jgi:hypothetical protein